jgi:hypothetical protein
VEVDVVVPGTLLSDGDETSALILPATPLQAGAYRLELAFERTRWDTTTTTDPESVYQDQAEIQLSW